MSIKIYARNYRGFRELDFSLDGNTFLVGDNSSGKSSVVALVNYVVSSELNSPPMLPDSGSMGRYDFFSPYFDYDDVIVGFSSVGPKGSIVKIITMRQQKDLMTPAVLRFTVIHGNKRITFKRTNSLNSQFKISEVSADLTWEQVCEVHNQNSGFKKIQFPENEFDGNPINTPNFMYSVLSYLDFNKEYRQVLLRATNVNIPKGVAHIGPLRDSPEPYYALERTYNSKGSHFAVMWHDIKKIKRQEYIDIVRKFGEDSQLFEDVDVEKMAKKVAHSPLIVTVRKRNRNFTLSQVGVGVSQVVPVLVDSIFRKATGENVLMLLQQPELHLHPIAQAALGEFIFQMADEHMWFVIETHSDYLMDRFRVMVREEKSKAKNRILFCENKNDGNHCSIIEINEDGELVSPPQHYRDFQVNELLRTMF